MWHLEAKFCPLCGSALVEGEVEGRVRTRCSACRFVLYLNPASAAAGVVLTANRDVLLIQRAIQPYRGYWALPAGYQEMDEDPAETVVREIREEAGLEVVVETLLDLIFVPDDPRKPANVAVFLCRPESEQELAVRPGDDAKAVAWFPLNALPQRIGFRNNRRILERLRDGDGYPERLGSGPPPFWKSPLGPQP